MYVHLLAIPWNCSQIGRTKCASHFDWIPRNYSQMGSTKCTSMCWQFPGIALKLGVQNVRPHFDGNSKELLSNCATNCTCFAANSKELLSNGTYKMYVPFAGNSKELLSDGMYVPICWQLHHMMSPKCHLHAVCSFCLLIQHGHFSILKNLSIHALGCHSWTFCFLIRHTHFRECFHLFFGIVSF